MKKEREARLVPKPKFRLPKNRWSNPTGHKYFLKRMREIRRSLPKNGA